MTTNTTNITADSGKENCLNSYSDQNDKDGSTDECPLFYDDVLCWPPTPINSTHRIYCTIALQTLLNEYHVISEDAVAFRVCQSNGTWALRANYDQCIKEISKIDTESTTRIVTLITFIGSLLSLLLLLVSLYIFVTFRSIQCDRLTVHKNLVTALIIHFVLMIIWIEPFITGEERTPSYRDVDYVCKTLLSLKMFAQLASTNWLFNEGYYLHSRITVNIFNTSDAPIKFFHALGWGFSAVCVIIWAALMHVFVDGKIYKEENEASYSAKNNSILLDDTDLANSSGGSFDDVQQTSVDKCWKGYSNYPYLWIITGPMTMVIFLNFLFLVNVVRILVTKLRANSTPETDQISPISIVTSLRVNKPLVIPRRRIHFPQGTERMTALTWWKAMKAVGVLFGFLGFSNFIFFINPKDGGYWEDAYYIINAIMQSSQGIVVSFLYCFMSEDVRMALKKRYYRHKVRYQSRRMQHLTRVTSKSHHTQTTSIKQSSKTRNARKFKIMRRELDHPLNSNKCDEEANANFRMANISNGGIN